MAQGTIERAAACHDAVLHGVLRDLDGTLAELRGSATAETIAWMHALHAAAWFADPSRGRIAHPDELEPVTRSSAEARRIAGIACAHAERAAVLAFDANELARWLDLHARLIDDPHEPSLAIGTCWHALLDGRTEGVVEAAADTGRAASAAQLPATVVEATVVRALAAMIDRDLENATTVARRASRMARTEALPQSEYLANVVLARIRRLTGKPPLATRILTALLRVAPPAWHPWLGWELLLARGEAPAEIRDVTSSPASAAVDALAATLDAARSGDRPRFERAADDARAHAGGFFELARDVARLIVLADVRAPVPDADRALAAFCRGESSAVPDGLYGTCERSAHAREADVACVLAVPNARGRRFLAVGARLAGVATTRPDPGPSRQLRTDSAIAALALAGPEGFAEDALFKSLYGFEYVSVHHKGARDVLYHRVRQKLGDGARFERDGGRVRLAIEAPLVVPDPRCSPPEEHSLLQILAEAGHLSAKGASDALGVPLRTVRRALDRLAEDGACRAEKRGGRVEYYLEDTTFREPTDY